jgi:hypothetical protein
MCFLIMDIGHKDVLLRYPWLSAYKPRFSWHHRTINKKQLPIVLRTINPTKPQDMVICYLSSDKREGIVAELEKECQSEPPTIQNATVEQAVAVQQYTKQVEFPWNTENLPKCSVKRSPRDSHHGDPTTMPSSSKQACEMPSTARYTP